MTEACLIEFVMDHPQIIFQDPVLGKPVWATEDHGLLGILQERDRVDPEGEAAFWYIGPDLVFDFVPDGFHGALLMAGNKGEQGS